MLKEMKVFFAADIALVKEDFEVMTARVRALEDDGDITRGKQDDLKTKVNRLQQINLSMEGRLAVLQDSKQQRNLRISGVPEDITNNEVPHYLHRMLSSMPSQGQSYDTGLPQLGPYII
ncbi:Hypothetical predicted protein [Pelobates cultripes]|uniref:Uncharacterized protein n=1 Tax=Pelobates cultripes TaxID=61616 RepID=A0AAD1WC04_PELCU|nr:Hypothetical predicted protein [Pelobates cultripes]